MKKDRVKILVKELRETKLPQYIGPWFRYYDPDMMKYEYSACGLMCLIYYRENDLTWDYPAQDFDDVLDWFGLKALLVNCNNKQNFIAIANDSGKTFAEIADMIETRFLTEYNTQYFEII